MSEEKTSLGLTPNVTAALAYGLWLIGGIIIYLIEKDNKFVRYHAMQSIMMFGALLILSILLGFIPVINLFAAFIMPVVVLVCWVYGIIKAAGGESFKFPFIGDLAEKQI